jgi:uncharacterized protein
VHGPTPPHGVVVKGATVRLVDQGGLEMLDYDECLRLLAAGRLGRIGIVDHGQPVILTVNYALDGEAPVFRTGPGLKLRMGAGSPACFQLDSWDLDTNSGWSVLVTGRLEEVTGYDEGTLVSRVRELKVTPWAPGDRSHWMRLVPSRVSGRRVGPG